MSNRKKRRENGDGRQDSERKGNRADARGDRDDSNECVEEKLKRVKEMRKNYTERADLLAYREVRIYIKKRLVNDKVERREKIRREDENRGEEREEIIRPVVSVS